MTTVVNVRGGKTLFDVYIGRRVRAGKRVYEASPWANPYRIGRDGTREEVVAKYRAWLLDRPVLLARLPELRDKVLGCWCAPELCHGEVLAELANASEARET